MRAGASAVAVDRDRAPRRERGDRGLRHEAHLQVLRRQHLHDRVAGLHPFADAVQRVVHAPGGGCGDALLVELPLRLGDRRLRGVDLRGLRGDLLRAARQARDVDLFLQFAPLRGGRLRGRARIVELLFRQAAGGMAFVARELRGGPRGLRGGLRELRLRDRDFRRALARLQVGELRAGGRELVLRLQQRGRFADGFERRPACRRRVPPRDDNCVSVPDCDDDRYTNSPSTQPW